MSLFHRVLGLEAGATKPFDPHAPIPIGRAGDTDSVRDRRAALSAMPPARARYVAAFAYLLGRAAKATAG